MAKGKGLGRGLDALFEDYTPPASTAPTPEAPNQTLPLHRVEPNPNQPRRLFDEVALQELADSIAQHGMIQPITVRALPNGYYQIIAGERRWRAARLAGLKEIPANIIEADDRKAAELALIENLQREDLNPIEEAQGFQQLIEQYGLTQQEAADQVGKSRPAIANSLRLLALAPSVLQFVLDGQLSAGHARAVLRLEGEKLQLTAAQKIIESGLSVRQAEALCKRLGTAPKEKPPADPFAVDYLAECEKDLSRRLGRGIKIANGKRKGRIELEYYGQDDLVRLVDALGALTPMEEIQHGETEEPA